MYKLLIADDEPLVQVGIKSMLPWASMDIEITGIAANGQAALNLIESDMPDIVITDIKMPIMTGLELARTCQERYGDNQPAFIILTSYEDFEFVREALHCQVCDYLIKLELTPDVLRASIEKVIEKIKTQPGRNTRPIEAPYSLSSYHDKFFISLLHNLFEDREQFLLQCQELKLNFNYQGYVCCYCEIMSTSTAELSDEQQLNLFHTAFQMGSELFSKYRFCHAMVLDLHHFALIFCYDNDASDFHDSLAEIIANVRTTLHNYYNVSLHTGVGTFVGDPLAITESYQYARDAFSNTVDETPTVFFDDLLSKSDFKKSFNFAIFKDDLARAYEEFDAGTLNSTLTAIIELFKAHPGHYLQAMDCASNILYLSISLLPEGETIVSELFKENPDGYRALYKLTNTDQIVSWLVYFRDSLCAILSERKKESRKPIVSNVKRYIREHVEEHLSLNEVAAVFGISPNYLSQLFKKYNDTGYNDYVTQCKIDEARKLLGSGSYKVYEVAERLGFESAFYFSKVFKKVVGVPPTEYMQKE